MGSFALDSPTLVVQVLQIAQTAPLMGMRFTRKGPYDKQLDTNGVEMVQPLLRRVRVIAIQDGSNSVLWNPPSFNACSLWLYEEGFVVLLSFDPREWNWAGVCSFQTCQFLNYSSYLGHRIQLQNFARDSNVHASLHNLGFNDQQQKMVIKSLENNAFSAKLSFNWLILVGGLPTGSWYAKMGKSSFA